MSQHKKPQNLRQNITMLQDNIAQCCKTTQHNVVMQVNTAQVAQDKASLCSKTAHHSYKTNKTAQHSTPFQNTSAQCCKAQHNGARQNITMLQDTPNHITRQLSTVLPCKMVEYPPCSRIFIPED
jgi:hypothetical protein